MSSNLQIPKTCVHCGRIFIAKTTVTKFCSKTCSNRNHKQRIRENKVQSVLTQQNNSKDSRSYSSTTNDNINSKEFLSIQDAALLLGASRWTIQRLIKKNALKSSKIGSRTIISRNEINKIFN